MKSFRIVDTRFRILKGGKIGLAMSVAMVGGMLTFSSTSANAAEYNGYPSVNISVSSTQGSVGVYSSQTFTYWDGSSWVPDSGSTDYNGNISIAAGVNLTGTTITDTDGFSDIYSVYSQDKAHGDGTETWSNFGSGSTLNLAGNNTISGIVGANVTSDGFFGVDPLGLINIATGTVTFNNNVYSDRIEINSGANINFYGNISNDTSSVIDYNGHNATVTLNDGSNLDGSIVKSSGSTNGTLIFEGDSTITGSVADAFSTMGLVSVRGEGKLVTIGSDLSTDHLDYQATSTVTVGGDLILNVNSASDSVNTVTFGSHDGVLNVGGDIIGVEGKDTITTTGHGVGTVTMLGGTQSITGNIGTSANKIWSLNIGDTASEVYSVTTANGDIYATNTVFNNLNATNGSELRLGSGYDITSTITTADNGMGTLKLLGGTQTVTGTVGASGNSLAEIDSGVAVGDNSTFMNNVVATNIYVNAGTSNFTDSVTATTTTIGSGTANFNTNNTGTTNSAIAFNGAGTANLHTGLSGTVNFAGNDATVYVWNDKSILGAITTATSNTGTVNYRGDGTITSTVGTTGMGIKELNINTNNEQIATTSVLAKNDIYAGSVNLKNDAILTLDDNVNIIGTGNSGSDVTALTGAQQVISTDVSGTGTLYLNGSSTITGVVGANNMVIGTIHAMEDGSTVVFNNMVYADTLWAYNNTIILNGQAGLLANGTAGTNTNSTIAGLKGTIDFDLDGAGTIEIGDGVNLTTGADGIQFVDANRATLTFNGTSTVHGDVGSLNGTDAFKVINAGVTTEAVTFNNNIYFMDSLNLSTDGTVEIADGKYARRNSTSATTGAIVTTTTDGLGNLTYKGGTTLYGEIGTSTAMLKSVTFNSASNNVTQNIGHSVYADTVTVGGTSGTTALSLANVTGVYDYAGATTMKEYRGGTAANITADVTLGGDLTIANDTSAINFGKSHVTVGMKSDGTTAGNFDTNGGAISFTVNTNDISSNNAQSTSTDSALVTVAGNLSMDGDEKVHVNYVGSLANSGSYTVVNAAGGTTANGTVNTVVAGAYNQNESGNVSDNSFSIDTRVATNATGDLIAYADRTGAASGTTYVASQNYVYKSGTLGDLSNNAATVLGGIAASGTQTGDMVQVIQKLDIDSFGYGNNQQNLETQVKRLAPIVNASLSQSAIGANTLTLNTVSNRIADLRGDSVTLPRAGVTGMSAGDEIAAVKGVWAKVIAATATQKNDGMYDGYKTRSAGLAMGIDREFKYDITAGLAFGYTRTNVDQQDFRSGDEANTDSYNLVAYVSKNFEKAYVEGALSYAMHNTESTRATAVGRTAKADIDADQYTAHISGGYRFNIKDRATVTPFLALDYTHLAQDGYTETGAGAINLKVDEMSTNRTTVGGGFRVGTAVESAAAILRPELKLAAYHISGGSNTDISAQYVGGGEKFVTPGTDLSSMMYNVGLGLKAETSKSTSFGVSIDYDRSSDGLFQGYTGQLVGRYEF